MEKNIILVISDLINSLECIAEDIADNIYTNIHGSRKLDATNMSRITTVLDSVKSSISRVDNIIKESLTEER